MKKEILTISLLAAILCIGVAESHAVSSELKSELTNSESTAIAEETNVARRPLAIVRRFIPDVLVGTESGWDQASQAQQLFSSDTLRTGEEGYAVVQFMDNSVAKVSPNSVLIITGEITSGGTTAARLAMELGEVFLEVSGRNSDYEMASPHGAAAIKGTEVNTEVDEGGSTFTVFRGLVGVRNPAGEEIDIGANQQTSVDGDGNMHTRTITEEEILNYRGRFEEKDEQAQSGGQDNVRDVQLRFTNDEGEEIRIRVRLREQN